MIDLSTRKKILIHLKYYDIYRDEDEVPYKISQPGIAEVLGLSRPYISKELKDLAEDEKDLVFVDLKRVKGFDRKRKVYFLTERGIEEEKKIRERLEEERITLKTEDVERKIKLKEVDEYLDDSEPLLKAINKTDKNGVLDLTEEVEEKKDTFAGRKNELSRLKEELTKVEVTGVSLLFISGEAGIGKTRLIHEFRDNVVKESAIFLSGTCYFEGSDPYLPFKKAFNRIDDFEIDPKDVDIEDEDMFTAERRATFYKTTELIEKLSQEKPLVIFLDDLHWAGEASLQLLYYMVDNLEESAVLFIGTYRPQEAEMNDAFIEIKQRMLRERVHEEIRLGSLDRNTTETMVKKILSAEEVPEELSDMIHELSEGNPLFIREFSKALLDEGLVDTEEGVYPRSKDEITIPTLVDQIIDRRIDTLSEETRQVLKTGGVIGEEVPYELLENISSMDELRLLDHIGMLVENELWSEDPVSERFKFAHTLFRKVPLEKMSTIRKRKLHSKAAESILKIYGDEIEDWYSDLALHHSEAEEDDKAIEYYLKAAERAEKVYAQEDALEMYEKALELISDSEESMRVQVLEKMSDVNRVLGNYHESRNVLEKAMLITDDSQAHQRMYRKIAKTFERQGEFKRTLLFVEKGLSISEAANEERCKLLDIKGWILMETGEPDKAQEIFDEVMDLGEELENKEIMADALHSLGTLELRVANYQSALDRLSESIELKEEIGYEKALGRSLQNKGIIYLHLGELNKALDALSKSIEIEEKIGNKKLLAIYLINQGNVYRVKGELDTVEKKYQDSFDIFKKVGDKRGMCLVLNNLGDIYRIRGDLEGAMERYERSHELSIEIDLDQGKAQSMMNIGYVMMLKGNYEEAVSRHEKALEIAEDMGDIKSEMRARARLGKVYLNTGELEKARDHLEEAVETYRELDEKVEIIDWKSHLSEVYLCLEETEKASRSVEEALRLAKQLGSLYREIQGRCVLGMILREKGERQRALKEFKKALELAEEKGKMVDKVKILYEKSLLFEDMGELGKAKRYAMEAMELSEKMDLKYIFKRCNDLLARLE